MPDIVHVPPGRMSDFQGQFEDLFHRVAEDFVPSLHLRTGTIGPVRTVGPAEAVDPAGTVDRAGIVDPHRREHPYLADMEEQHNLLSLVENQVVGFLSFVAACRLSEVQPPGDALPDAECVYVSTVAVRPDHRNQGHATRMYQRLLALREEWLLPEWIVLRTWEGNERHRRLVAGLGFRELYRVPEERPGRIDTVYLARPASADASPSLPTRSSADGPDASRQGVANA